MADIDKVNISEPTETLSASVLEKITKDDLPCNVYDVAQTEPLVLLGKINEVVANLKGIGKETSDANTKADEALNLANDAKSKVSLAVSTANSANTHAGDALSKATTAQNRAESAYSLAESSLTIASSASDLALDAQQKAEQALDQVVGGTGSKVYDHDGNLMPAVKLAGENGINIDHSESDAETLNIRLDNTITTAIEDTHTQSQTNASRLDQVESTLTELTPRVSKSLVTPLDAPAETQLVAIDTTNAQKMLGIGEGLSIVNGDVQVAEELLDELDAKANDNSVLHLAGNETITGTKLVEGTINIQPSGHLYLNNNRIIGSYANLDYQGSSNMPRALEMIASHNNNYIKYGSGLCIQTGTISTTGKASYTITLPISMPSTNYMVFASGVNYPANKLTMSSHLVSQTNTQFEISLSYNTSSANYPTGSTYRWVAICLPTSSGFIGD